MTDAAFEIRDWSDRLNAATSGSRRFTNVTVMQDVDSTQDAAIRLGLRPGAIITAGRQTRGRGRLGRRWIDDDATGTATTFVLAPAAGPRRSIEAAVAAAITVERCLDDDKAKVRWPNDIMVGGAKIAGILIEQDATTCRVGIGINVAPSRAEHVVNQPITNLMEHGYRGDRCGVIEHLIRNLDEALGWSDAVLSEAWQSRDLLTGTRQAFRNGETEVVGDVESVDPFVGIRIRVPGSDASMMLDGDRWTKVQHAAGESSE